MVVDTDDEWNIWDLIKAPGSAGLKQIYDYTDLLGFVAWLSVLVRKHKDLGLACLAQTVNVVCRITSRVPLSDTPDFTPVDDLERCSQADDILSVSQAADKAARKADI